MDAFGLEGKKAFVPGGYGGIGEAVAQALAEAGAAVTIAGRSAAKAGGLAKKLFAAYMPYKFVGHRIETAVFHPWVVGYRRHSFMRAMWKYVDIDNDLKGERGA